jgi:SAM-dependent methyltransferase
MSFKDHFSSHAAGYAAYRPTYPSSLIEFLAQVSPRTDLAIDCGCGTGQLSVPLARRFARVVAIDASAAQIATATPDPRVEYRVAAAESTGEADHSADLLTVAQAAHWLELERFYTEARRVLRPAGVLALITYGVLRVDDALDAVVQHFYRDVIGPYWPPERQHVDSGYRNLPFPFVEMAYPPMAIEVSWTLPEFIGYVDTWSAVRAAEKMVGRAPIDAFAEQLAAAWGERDRRRTVQWPLSLRITRL